MANENANQNIEINDFKDDFDFEEAESVLLKKMEVSFSDLELLEKDREHISNPDSFGKVCIDEIWNQFANQTGLDITKETLNQKYDRVHSNETYAEESLKAMKDSQYKNANKEMKRKHESGVLTDEYTGKTMRVNDKANLDHVVSRRELYDNARRKQADLGLSDVANMKENLKPTNESLNKSKGKKSIDELVETRDSREKELVKQNKRANEKVDASNKSSVEKRWEKAKNDKRLKDKLDAKDNLMKEIDKKARADINKKVRVVVAKKTGQKAAKDALKVMAVSALFSLLKEVANALIRFFKEKDKSFKIFLVEMKAALKAFFSKISSFFKTGLNSFVGTIVFEVFGPIVNLFKKMASFIKQGVSSLIDAVNYLLDKKNNDKPFAIKVAQVGKIITAGLVAGGAIALGEFFEMHLLVFPIMLVEIPLIGTLANIIGLFLASLLSGLVGAFVLNIIDKFIAKKLKEENGKKLIVKKNEIINLQEKQRFIVGNQVASSRENAMTEMSKNHEAANKEAIQLLKKIFDKDDEEDIKNNSSNQSDLKKMQKDLENLL